MSFTTWNALLKLELICYISVHKQSPPPISIFSRLYFSTSLLPEISPDAPFMTDVASVGNLTESDPKSQLYPAFKPLPDYDVVLQKTRYFAGADNTLVQILQSQKIDTVILVCLMSEGQLLNKFLTESRTVWSANLRGDSCDCPASLRFGFQCVSVYIRFCQENYTNFK